MNNITISKIKGRQIFDSRGVPTVEVDVTLSDGSFGRFGVASGASTGSFEAVELRDNGEYNLGKSVYNAVKNVNTIIAPALIGKNPFNQREIDELMCELDGTENKSNLGANAILGVSVAVLKASAMSRKETIYAYTQKHDVHEMPIPMMNIINGGKHADNNLNIQEFMIMPISANSFRERMDMCTNVFQNLKKILKADGYGTSVGDEGGFAPNFKDDESALEYICKAIEKAGYVLGEDFVLSLDIASSEMKTEAIKKGEPDKYYFWKTDKMYTIEELIEFYKMIVEKYFVTTIEDGFGEEDWDAWKLLTKELGDKIQLIGDDLFVTNQKRFQKGIDNNIANSILIKLNQIGTVTETIDTIMLAKKNGYKTVISHRSGETEDTYISHLAVGTNAGQIKMGAPSRGERVAKYNELLRIEENEDIR